MNENSGSDMDRQRAETIARHAARSVVGLEHSVSVTRTGNMWVFVFLPPGRVRGGGAQVTVKKTDTTIEVVDVVFLQ
jgi:hypothetical protein